MRCCLCPGTKYKFDGFEVTLASGTRGNPSTLLSEKKGGVEKKPFLGFHGTTLDSYIPGKLESILVEGLKPGSASPHGIFTLPDLEACLWVGYGNKGMILQCEVIGDPIGIKNTQSLWKQCPGPPSGSIWQLKRSPWQRAKEGVRPSDTNKSDFIEHVANDRDVVIRKLWIASTVSRQELQSSARGSAYECPTPAGRLRARPVTENSSLASDSRDSSPVHGAERSSSPQGVWAPPKDMVGDAGRQTAVTENLPQKGFRPYPPFDKPRPALRVVLRSVSRRKQSRTPPRRRRHRDLDAFTAEAPWNQEQSASTTPFSLWPLPSTDPRPSPPEPPVAHSQLEAGFPKPQRPDRCEAARLQACQFLLWLQRRQ